MNSEKKTGSPEETIEFGRCLAEDVGPGRIFSLYGNLGGGKTVLAKGLAKGLGVSDTDLVTSPTFTLVNRYQGEGGIIYHIDLYRLHCTAEAVDMGIEEILCSGETVIIEWPERIEDLLEKVDVIRIDITSAGETDREFRVSL